MQMNQQTPHAAKAEDTAKLEECLQGELSAVETYELALKSINHVGLHRALQEILESHALRAERIRERISRAGAEAPKSSGVWGAFTKVVQAGADLLGDRVAIATLEEGEDRGLAMYTSGLEGCDAKTRKFIDTELLPEQRRTHDLCRSLKTYVKAPS
jgi:demethoxyubiquinone hydroxylase (CLK1/Coq7/Cat5 family)